MSKDISIASWNIQNGLGTDGVRSMERIASEIEAMGLPDILCLQEVSRGLPLGPDAQLADQVKQLQELFADYDAVFGPAYDMVLPETGARAQYGNMILSRLPVLSQFSHPLPQPARAGRRQMPRQLTEVTVACGKHQELRVMTTHLEFHSRGQRLAQIQAIRQIHQQIVALAQDAPAFDESGPYQRLPRAEQAVICGDLNCLPDSAEMKSLISAAPNGQLSEVWARLHPNEPHEPTCGIFDGKQWPQGAHCRDYFVVSDSLLERCRRLHTNTKTNASDHQPVMLTLAI